MSILRELRRRARLIAPQAVLACATAYFVYHAIHGERGVMAWLRLEQDLERSQASYAEVAARRDELEQRVNRLRPDNLDPDLLEEQARRSLNYTRPDEVIVPLPDGTGKVD